MSDLKPCPFCGEANPTYYPGVELWPCVKCDNCGCETGHDEVAVERWNSRAPRFTAEERKVLEAAEDAVKRHGTVAHLKIIRAMLDAEPRVRLRVE
jgi:hypothetical protein